MRGTNASLRRRQTSIVWRPYSKNCLRASSARLGPSPTPSALTKLSRMPSFVRVRNVTARPLPTTLIVFSAAIGSQRAP